MKLGKHYLWVVALLILSPFVALTADSAHAAGNIEVMSSSVTSEFPQGIRFRLDATSENEIAEVAVRFRVGQQTRGSYDYLDVEQEGTLVNSELFFRTSNNYIPPGTIITYRFEILDSEEYILETEWEEFIYHDPRFEWEEISEGAVTVAYHGPVKRRAEVILEAILEATDIMGPLLGADSEEPIRVTVFNSIPEMRPALPPGSATRSRELVTEGQAFVDIGTLLVLGSGNRVRGTAAHEVTHILTHRAGDSVFRNVPQWLDEGLAEYGNSDPGVSYDIALSFALANDRLLPITSMPALPGNSEDVIIYYGQARSIVAFMVSEFGEDKMGELMAVMKSGKNVEDSIEAVYGVTRIELENMWRSTLDAPEFVPPDLTGVLPTPEPTPVLELFTLDSLRGTGSAPTPEAAEEPTATPQPEPTSTPVVVAQIEQPTAEPEAAEPAEEAQPPEPVTPGSCNAPLHGGSGMLELSSVALLIGLVGLGVRRRIRFW